MSRSSTEADLSMNTATPAAAWRRASPVAPAAAAVASSASSSAAAGHARSGAEVALVVVVGVLVGCAPDEGGQGPRWSSAASTMHDSQ